MQYGSELWYRLWNRLQCVDNKQDMMLHALSRINTFPARTFAESRPRFQYATCCYGTQYNCGCRVPRYFAVYEKWWNSFTLVGAVTRLWNERHRNQRSIPRRSMKVEPFRKLPDGLSSPQSPRFKRLSGGPPQEKKCRRAVGFRWPFTTISYRDWLSVSVPPLPHTPSRPEPHYLTWWISNVLRTAKSNITKFIRGWVKLKF